MRRILLLFIVGFVGGLAGDAFHILSGTSRYLEVVTAGPMLFVSAWWFPVIVGVIAVVMGELLRHREDSWLRKSRRVSTVSSIAISFLVFLGIYALSACGFWIPDVVLTPWLYVLSVLVWWILDRTWIGFGLGWAFGLLGAAGEIFMISKGVFLYQVPAAYVGGVPRWLPALYFCGAMAVGQMSRSLGTRKS